MENIRPFTPLERHTEVLSSALPKESTQQFTRATKGTGTGGPQSCCPFNSTVWRSECAQVTRQENVLVLP